MNKKKSFFGICLIVTFVIIISAIVMSLTLGINLGSDIGGGTQFEVVMNGTTASKKDIKVIKEIVKDNGESVETIFVEDKMVDSVIVVRIADKKIEKQAEIKNAIIEKLSLEQDDISSFNIFNGSVTNKNVLHTGIALACLLLLAFLAGWFRYNIVAGLSSVFMTLHTLILMVSLFIVTRLPLTLTSVTIILAMLAAVLFAFVLLLEKIRANSKLKQNESLTTNELVNISKKPVLKVMMLFAALFLVFSLVMVCVPVKYVALTACSLFVCLLVGVYSFVFVGIPMHERLYELKLQTEKLRLSKNSSPAPSKKKTTNK